MVWFKKKDERRRHVRYQKNVKVEIKSRTCRVAGALTDVGTEGVVTDGDGTETVLTGRDISRGGLCFFSDTPLEPGAVLSLVIRISASEEQEKRQLALAGVTDMPIRTDVRVMWCRFEENAAGYAVGVSFVNIFIDDYKLLARSLAPME